MVDEVLIARARLEHALHDQGLHVTQRVGAMAPVAKAGGEAIDESKGLVGVPDQQRPGVPEETVPSKSASTRRRPLPKHSYTATGTDAPQPREKCGLAMPTSAGRVLRKLSTHRATSEKGQG